MKRLSAYSQGSAIDRPGADHDQRVPNDKSQIGEPPGPKWHPNSNLVRTMRDHERHHTIGADNREQEGNRCETARQCCQHRLPKSHRYRRLTDYGLPTAWFFTRSYNRIARPWTNPAGAFSSPQRRHTTLLR